MKMGTYEDKLQKYISEQNLTGQIYVFEQSCHTVEDAAKALNTTPDRFVKTICMVDDSNNLLVGIVKGEHRLNIQSIAQLLSVKKPRMASPQEIYEKTGYPVGGTPPFGYQAKFFIDQAVMETEEVYGGGGSDMSLVRIAAKELQRANKGTIAIIRK